MEQEIGTWDSVLLENLTEDCFINNINQRYKKDHIYVSRPDDTYQIPIYETSNFYAIYFRLILEHQ